MLGKIVISYIDNILIYSTSLEAHVNHVKRVLAWLLEHQLYVKGEKCFFHVPTVSFLVCIISQEGIKMNDTKVKAVTEWIVTCMLKDLQCFLEFANFYRRFI